ncbi:hypothetical protein B7494_g5373 [Chlorociboria aeruginascens]|nr:hypothetical protein B7494_g5373 [Chlorociboria aeruginascens]
MSLPTAPGFFLPLRRSGQAMNGPQDSQTLQQPLQQANERRGELPQSHIQPYLQPQSYPYLQPPLQPPPYTQPQSPVQLLPNLRPQSYLQPYLEPQSHLLPTESRPIPPRQDIPISRPSLEQDVETVGRPRGDDENLDQDNEDNHNPNMQGIETLRGSQGDNGNLYQYNDNNPDRSMLSRTPPADRPRQQYPQSPNQRRQPRRSRPRKASKIQHSPFMGSPACKSHSDGDFRDMRRIRAATRDPSYWEPDEEPWFQQDDLYLLRG